MERVASFTGAWIETLNEHKLGMARKVASFTGAWIETKGRISKGEAAAGRVLHGRVD